MPLTPQGISWALPEIKTPTNHLAEAAKLISLYDRDRVEKKRLEADTQKMLADAENNKRKAIVLQELNTKAQGIHAQKLPPAETYKSLGDLMSTYGMADEAAKFYTASQKEREAKEKKVFSTGDGVTTYEPDSGKTEYIPAAGKPAPEVKETADISNFEYRNSLKTPEERDAFDKFRSQGGRIFTGNVDGKDMMFFQDAQGNISLAKLPANQLKGNTEAPPAGAPPAGAPPAGAPPAGAMGTTGTGTENTPGGVELPTTMDDGIAINATSKTSSGQQTPGYIAYAEGLMNAESSQDLARTIEFINKNILNPDKDALELNKKAAMKYNSQIEQLLEEEKNPEAIAELKKMKKSLIPALAVVADAPSVRSDIKLGEPVSEEELKKYENLSLTDLLNVATKEFTAAGSGTEREKTFKKMVDRVTRLRKDMKEQDAAAKESMKAKNEQGEKEIVARLQEARESGDQKRYERELFALNTMKEKVTPEMAEAYFSKMDDKGQNYVKLNKADVGNGVISKVQTMDAINLEIKELLNRPMEEWQTLVDVFDTKQNWSKNFANWSASNNPKVMKAQRLMYRLNNFFANYVNSLAGKTLTDSERNMIELVYNPSSFTSNPAVVMNQLKSLEESVSGKLNVFDRDFNTNFVSPERINDILGKKKPVAGGGWE